MYKLTIVAVGVGSILLLCGLVYLLFALPTPHFQTVMPVATTTLAESRMKNTPTTVSITEPNNAAVIATWFAPLRPLTLGTEGLQASVADTDATRAQGLSGTPYLPTGVVKLFVFDTTALWSFWMKDMNYPIDIIWLDADKTVIHIESDLTPETYPQSFVPTTPAKYVIETQSGFTDINHITIGTKATW